MQYFLSTFKQNRPLLYSMACGLTTALFFSAFLYLHHFDIDNKVLNTLFGLIAFTLLLAIDKRAVLSAGFFIGLFWFYWIGYSFAYTGMGFITPIITFAFGLIYMLFFGLLAFTANPLLRALLLFALSFFEPFDFNWMQFELLFVESYFGVYKYQLALILLSLSLTLLLKNSWRYAPLLLLVFAMDYGTQKLQEAPLKIKLAGTDIKQEEKWKRENLEDTLRMIFTQISNAKEQGYEVIIFPESVFPMFLNHSPKIIDALKNYSQDISIVAGALLYEDSKNFNVTYIFEKGAYSVAKKMILVPFGEYIPLPSFARDYINQIFFNGEADFSVANEPTDFFIRGIKIRNAICYEATCHELYEGDVKYIFATSNNAWFAPSIEPNLQNLLLRLHSKKYGVVIYHSANYKGTGIIR